MIGTHLGRLVLASSQEVGLTNSELAQRLRGSLNFLLALVLEGVPLFCIECRQHPRKLAVCLPAKLCAIDDTDGLMQTALVQEPQEEVAAVGGEGALWNHKVLVPPMQSYK